jgi:hypothetical protein
MHMGQGSSALRTAIFALFGIFMVKGAVLAFAATGSYATQDELGAVMLLPASVLLSAMALYSLRETPSGMRSVL